MDKSCIPHSRNTNKCTTAYVQMQQGKAVHIKQAQHFDLSTSPFICLKLLLCPISNIKEPKSWSCGIQFCSKLAYLNIGRFIRFDCGIQSSYLHHAKHAIKILYILYYQHNLIAASSSCLLQLTINCSKIEVFQLRDCGPPAFGLPASGMQVGHASNHILILDTGADLGFSERGG